MRTRSASIFLKKPAPDAIRDAHRLSEKIMRHEKALFACRPPSATL
jgi:hypothetical protein